MRQFMTLGASFALMLAAAGSIHGGDGFDVWTGEGSQNPWNGHLVLPPTFTSPAAGWVTPLLMSDQTAGNGDRLMTGVGVKSPCGITMTCDFKECMATDKCEAGKCDIAKCDAVKCQAGTCATAKCDAAKCESANCEAAQCDKLQPVMAQIIAELRKNSPVARFGDSIEIPCLPNYCENSEPNAGYATVVCSAPLIAAAVPSTAPPMTCNPHPMYAHPPIYSHPMPMPIAMAPHYAPAAHNFPPVAYAPATSACCPNCANCANAAAGCCGPSACDSGSSPPVGAPCASATCCVPQACRCSTNACGCASNACKCAMTACHCSRTCQCAAPSCQCAAFACKCATAPCSCAASNCKCATAACPCNASACKCAMSACQCMVPMSGCPLRTKRIGFIQLPNGHCGVAPERIGVDFDFCASATAEDEEEEDDDKDCEEVQERLEHMLKAAKHLELAGMDDAADELRDNCVEKVGELARRLKAAESELARLKKNSANQPVSFEAPAPVPCAPKADSACCKPGACQEKAVQVHVKLAEVNLTKLRRLGFDVSKLNEEPQKISSLEELLEATNEAKLFDCDNNGKCTGIFEENSSLFNLLETLRENGVVELLADPTLTTLSGQSAVMRCDNEFPILVPQGKGTVSVDYKKFGTELNVVPLVTEGNNLRLEVRARHSKIDKSREVHVNGQAMPGLSAAEIDTAVEMKCGQTLLMCGPAGKRTDVEEVEVERGVETSKGSKIFRNVGKTKRQVEKVSDVALLVIVTPEIVESPCAKACKESSCSKGECAPCTKTNTCPRCPFDEPTTTTAPTLPAPPF